MSLEPPGGSAERISHRRTPQHLVLWFKKSANSNQYRQANSAATRLQANTRRIILDVSVCSEQPRCLHSSSLSSVGLIGRAIGSSAMEHLEWPFETASELPSFTASIHSVGRTIYWILLSLRSNGLEVSWSPFKHERIDRLHRPHRKSKMGIYKCRYLCRFVSSRRHTDAVRQLMSSMVAEMNRGLLHRIIVLEAKPEKTSLDWPVAITGTRETQPATFIVYTWPKNAMLQMLEWFSTQ
jgi:hypothetical protein